MDRKFGAWMIMILVLAGCAPIAPMPGSLGSLAEIGLDDGTTVYIPLLPAGAESLSETMEAPLMLREGCLRLGIPGYDKVGVLVLWPAEIHFRRNLDAGIDLFDGSQQPVGRSGATIRLGGGMLGGRGSVVGAWSALAREASQHGCPGPYFIASTLSVDDRSAGAASHLVRLGTPGEDFSLRFDPAHWEKKAYGDLSLGMQSLTHRTLPGSCRILPSILRPLWDGWRAETARMELGGRTLETRRVAHDDTLKYVAYAGFLGQDARGAVEVISRDLGPDCLKAAESLFASTTIVAR